MNLNFTARHALPWRRRLSLGQVTDGRSRRRRCRTKLPNFPCPANVLDLQTEAAAPAGGKRAMMPWLMAARVLPNQWMADLLGLPRRGDRGPGGIAVHQRQFRRTERRGIDRTGIFSRTARRSRRSRSCPTRRLLMACLPVFHSFGFTVTLWYPILRGCRVITVPSPLGYEENRRGDPCRKASRY